MKGGNSPFFCHFGTYYLNNNRVYFAQIQNRSLIMPVAPKLPMKFKCTACKTVYMHKYNSNTILNYPTCPDCQHAGQLQGTIETPDLFKYPVAVAKSYIQASILHFTR
jgi:hypothetical protein